MADSHSCPMGSVGAVSGSHPGKLVGVCEKRNSPKGRDSGLRHSAPMKAQCEPSFDWPTHPVIEHTVKEAFMDMSKREGGRDSWRKRMEEVK